MFLRSLVIPLSAASWREVLQQFLRSLIEPFLVLLLFFAGFNRMLGSTYPNELLCSRVVHTNDESPDVNGWGPWGGGLESFSATTSTINIGTFVVGMYDPAAKKLVWIGAAQHAIEPSKKQEKNQERLN